MPRPIFSVLVENLLTRNLPTV